MTAEGDFLNAQAEPLANALHALGVPAVYRVYGTKEAPLGHVFHLNVRAEEAVRCNRDECDFFRQYC